MHDTTITQLAFCKTDDDLRRELLEITAPSYENSSALITREWEHCNSLYLARKGNQVVCFFFVAWETVTIEGGGILPTLYLGLSATRQEADSTRLIGSLYLRCDKDIIAWETKHNQQLICWGTTATPIVYLLMRAFRPAIEPYLDGSYSPLGASLARAFRRKMTLPESGDEHPFVLKGVANGTRYSPQEKERIEHVAQAKKFSLLHELGVDESTGDRLLFIARTSDKLDFDYPSE